MGEKAERQFYYDSLLLGARIAQKRNLQKISQEGLAEMVEVSVATISHIENRKSVCDLNLLVRIAAVLEMDLWELIRGISLTGMEAKRYLEGEISLELERLTSDERRLVYGFILLLQEERQRGKKYAGV